jgi:hypothetical protein
VVSYLKRQMTRLDLANKVNHFVYADIHGLDLDSMTEWRKKKENLRVMNQIL